MERATRTTGSPTGPLLGSDLLPVHVVHREEIAREAVALWLAASGSERAPAPYLPGQFITVGVPAEGSILRRSYSLSGDGDPDLPWEITVKRHRAGKVSSFLYERAEPGMRLYASVPHGSFVLPRYLRPNMPLVFAAAGSGIAPIYGMLRAIALLPPERRPRVQLHYASESTADVLYGRELAALDSSGWWLHTWHYLSSRGQRMVPEAVLEQTGALSTAAHWYICGPEPFKRAFEAVALRRGVPPERIHVESFGDPAAREAARSGALSAAARVRIGPTGDVLHVRSGETLLEALERHGYSLSSQCRAGTCGECRLRVTAGRVHHPDGIALSLEEQEDGYVLSCVGRPIGDVTLASPSEVAPAAVAPRRAKTIVRASAVAASVALFVGALGLTAGQGASAPTSTTTSPTESSGSGSGASATSVSGRSHIATQLPFSVPSSATGVS